MTHRPTTPTLKLKNPKTWQVLRRARVLLQTHGWTQNTASRRNANGLFSYCAVGSTYAAVEGLPNMTQRYDSANAVLNAVADEKVGHSVISFNDKPGRKKAEVIALFREAESRARAANL